MCEVCLLMRHGESFANLNKIVWSIKYGFYLTENGKKMVYEKIKEIEKIKIEKIVTSQLQRAVETAKIISENLNISYFLDERLNELDFTIFSGHDESLVPKFTYESRFVEKWNDVMKRSIECINDYDGSVLFVTHAFIIRAILSYFLNLSENNSYGINVGYATLTLIKNGKILSIGAEHIDL